MEKLCSQFDKHCLSTDKLCFWIEKHSFSVINKVYQHQMYIYRKTMFFAP